MPKTILTACLILCSFLFCPTVWSAQLTAPLVVVSIKPLHALVAGVMQGVAEPQLLVKGGGSPHSYVLRPSEARDLSRADLIVWVGPQLESFLAKSLSTLGQNARQLELIEVLAAQLLPLRKGGSWEGHKHHTKGMRHEEHNGHDKHTELNPHLWLDPRLAQQIVTKTAATLAEIDPTHRQQYQQNAAQLHARLDSLHRKLTAKLAPVKEVPYIVFHDAYHYFEAAYSLNAIGSITVDPERKPGAKRIRQIREKIKQSAARCVFSEPQFEPRLLAIIIEGSTARTGVLDPLGADLLAGPESYFRLLNALADNLLRGLR